MSIYLLVFIYVSTLLTLHAPQPANATFDPTQMCSLIANGTFINDPRACNTWIQCVDGQPISGTCDSKLFYDKSTNTCVPSDSINCLSSNPCAVLDGATNFTRDPYSCNGYYYCSNGVAALGVCGSGMNFNSNTLDCRKSNTCILPMDPDSYCNIVPDGIFIGSTANCNDYEVCWEGNQINGTCPGALLFSAADGTCTNAQNVTCNEQVTNPPGLDAEIICPEAGAFVADNLTCNGYYYCKPPVTSGGSITLVWAECPVGRFFDPADGGSCISRTQIECNYSRCVNMGLTYIQLANESDDDCTGYAICQKGVQIGSGTCPEGEYFDEVTQFCTETVISYPSCVLSSEVSTTSPSPYSTVSDSDEVSVNDNM